MYIANVFLLLIAWQFQWYIRCIWSIYPNLSLLIPTLCPHDFPSKLHIFFSLRVIFVILHFLIDVIVYTNYIFIILVMVYIYVCALCAHAYVCLGALEGHRYRMPWSVSYRWLSANWYGCWELNSDSLWEQYALASLNNLYSLMFFSFTKSKPKP